MNPTLFAMRRPITVVMIIVALLGAGVLALNQMRVDIFPAINAPQIYVLNNYAGMDPSQIEGIITNVYELNFQYVDGLKGIESKNIQNMVMLKLTFYPGTDMAAAMSQVVSLANRARGQMPPSVLPPFVMRFDAANVPIGYLVLESKTRPLGELADLGMYNASARCSSPSCPARSPFRPSAATPGRSSSRSIPTACGRTTSRPRTWCRRWGPATWSRPPAICICRGRCRWCPPTPWSPIRRRWATFPFMPGSNVYIRDVATIADATDINYGCALVNGRKSIYIPVVKKDTASTLTVVNQIHESMPLFRSVVPEDVSVRYEFDESPTVRAAIKSVATEGLIGAGLTGLMILLFLRDVRSVVVVLVSIPCSLTFALVGLWLTGNTLNIMSLGGLALAIGILVDEAVVTIENTHAQMLHTDSVARAARRASRGHGHGPPLGHALHSVGVHPHVHLERARPLAVHAADPGGGILHDRLLPALQHAGAGALGMADAAQGRARGRKSAFFDRLLPRLQPPCGGRDRGFAGSPFRDIWRPAGCCSGWSARQVGTELFPQVDSGQFVIRFRAPPGSEYELTRKLAVKMLEVIDQETQHKVAISMGYVGLAATNTATNNMLLFMRGPDDGQIRVRLWKGAGVHLADLRERLRKALPEQLVPWTKEELQREGYSAEEAQSMAGKIVLRFRAGRHRQRGDELRLADPRRGDGGRPGPGRGPQARAEGPRRDEEDSQPPRRAALPAARLPDRAGGHRPRESGPQRRDGQGRYRRAVGGHVFQPLRGQELLARPAHAASITRSRSRSPCSAWTGPSRWRRLPLQKVSTDSNLMVRDVANVQTGIAPGEIDRSSMQRYLSITANVEGEDLGRASVQIAKAIADAGAAAARGAGHGPRPGRAHDGDVPVAGRRPGPLRGGDPGHVDRLLPVVQAGTGLDRRGAGRGLRRGDHPLGDRHDAEHRVVHGLDHVHRRLGVQLGDARRPSWTITGGPARRSSRRRSKGPRTGSARC